HRPRVPRDGDPFRPVVREQLEEHVREAEQGVRRHALARRQLLRQCEVGPIRPCVAAAEEALAVARRRVVELKLFSGQSLWAQGANGIVLRRCRDSKSSPSPKSIWRAPARSWPSAIAAIARRSRCSAPTTNSMPKSTRSGAPTTCRAPLPRGTTEGPGISWASAQTTTRGARPSQC